MLWPYVPAGAARVDDDDNDVDDDGESLGITCEHELPDQDKQCFEGSIIGNCNV